MISVVLCCYNGEKYINDQLMSIYKQSKQVDEVIIYDDGSLDNTITICTEFIKNNSLNNWKVVQNKSNQGVYLNFIKGCIEAKGDIIFLADQDDIWHYDKVQVMDEYFKSNNKILSLATGFRNIDSQGNLISEKVKHPYANKNDIRKIEFTEFLKFYNYLGMTMAIRKSLIDDFFVNCIDKQIERKKAYLTHDIALNFYSVLNNGLYFLDRELVTRRTHLQSTSNMRNPNFQDTILEDDEVFDINLINTRMYISAMEWFLNLLDLKFEKEKEIILKYKEFYERRYNILSSKNMKKLIKFRRHVSFYKTPFHYIKDYLYIIKR